MRSTIKFVLDVKMLSICIAEACGREDEAVPKSGT